MSSFRVSRASNGSFSMSRRACPCDIVRLPAQIRSTAVVKAVEVFKTLMGGEYELCLPYEDDVVRRINILRKHICESYRHCADDSVTDVSAMTPITEIQTALSFLSPILLISKAEIVVALLNLRCLLCLDDGTLYAKVQLKSNDAACLNDIVGDNSWVRLTPQITSLPSSDRTGSVSNAGDLQQLSERAMRNLFSYSEPMDIDGDDDDDEEEDELRFIRTGPADMVPDADSPPAYGAESGYYDLTY